MVEPHTRDQRTRYAPENYRILRCGRCCWRTPTYLPAPWRKRKDLARRVLLNNLLSNWLRPFRSRPF